MDKNQSNRDAARQLLQALANEYLARPLTEKELSNLIPAGEALQEVRDEALRAINRAVREGGSSDCIGLCALCDLQEDLQCGERTCRPSIMDGASLREDLTCPGCRGKMSRRYAWSHAGLCHECYEKRRRA